MDYWVPSLAVIFLSPGFRLSTSLLSFQGMKLLTHAIEISRAASYLNWVSQSLRSRGHNLTMAATASTGVSHIVETTTRLHTGLIHHDEFHVSTLGTGSV